MPKPYKPKPRPKDGGLMPYQERRLREAIAHARFQSERQRKAGKPVDYGRKDV